MDAENRRVHASSFVTGWRTGCDTLSARFYRSNFSYKQLGSVSCTPCRHNSGQMCSGNKWLSQAYGVMRTACLVAMAQHQLNSISPIIHLRRIHPWAEEQDELCVTACVCGQ